MPHSLLWENRNEHDCHLGHTHTKVWATRRYIRSGGNVLEKDIIYSTDDACYIYAGNDQLVMIDGNSNLFYYIKDHLGSTRMTIRDNGTVYGRYYKYFAFGGTESEQVSLNQEYKYTGKPLDEEFDLDTYYYGARYYNPRLGRWLAVDPLHKKYPGWSPYAYSLNNPITLLDPDGNKVVFKGAFQQEDMQALYKQATDYLGEHGLGGTFMYLEDMPQMVYLDFTLDPWKQSFNIENNTIYWNPCYLTVTTDDGRQSAALTLLHEGSHALHHATRPGDANDMASQKDDQYKDKEERMIIEDIESPAAERLGEDKRTDKKAKVFLPSASPISTTSISWEDIAKRKVWED